MKNKGSKPPAYYPIFLNIQGTKCVVVGGGQVALLKVKMLLECGANVFVVSPEPLAEIKRLAKRKTVHLIRRNYKTGDLKDAIMAIACTDVKEVNLKVADEAKKTEVLINVADDPERSDFISPAFFKRGNLTVAVSTAGISPAFARKVRTKLEKSIGREYAALLTLIGQVRTVLRKKGYRVSTEAWQDALNLDLLPKLIQSGQRKKAKALLLSKLEGNKWRK